MRLTLHIDGKRIATGSLSIDRDGHAIFLDDGQHVLASLKRSRLDFVGARGMQVSGFADLGVDRIGRTKFSYVEWWLSCGGEGE